MTLKTFWNTLDRKGKRHVTERLSSICQVSERAVQSWVKGDRHPSSLCKKIVADYIQTHHKVKIEWE